MKMLTSDSNYQYLLTLKERLEEAGIPSVIQGRETARMIVPGFLLEPTLWVYINEQFDDAVQLLADPDYKVTTAIDVAEFYANQPADDEADKTLGVVLGNLALYFVLIMVLIYIATKVFNTL